MDCFLCDSISSHEVRFQVRVLQFLCASQAWREIIIALTFIPSFAPSFQTDRWGMSHRELHHLSLYRMTQNSIITFRHWQPPNQWCQIQKLLCFQVQQHWSNSVMTHDKHNNTQNAGSNWVVNPEPVEVGAWHYRGACWGIISWFTLFIDVFFQLHFFPHRSWMCSCFLCCLYW